MTGDWFLFFFFLIRVLENKEMKKEESYSHTMSYLHFLGFWQFLSNIFHIVPWIILHLIPLFLLPVTPICGWTTRTILVFLSSLIFHIWLFILISVRCLSLVFWTLWIFWKNAAIKIHISKSTCSLVLFF